MSMLQVKIILWFKVLTEFWLILSFLCFLEFPDYSWIKEIDNQPRLKILTSEYDFDL